MEKRRYCLIQFYLRLKSVHFELLKFTESAIYDPEKIFAVKLQYGYQTMTNCMANYNMATKCGINHLKKL